VDLGAVGDTARLPANGRGVSLRRRFQDRIPFTDPSVFMPFAPEVQQLIQQVEQLSGRPVHVAEEPGMTMRATVTPARSGAPAHMVRFKPGSPSLDYLVASQLVFLVRTFT
jgi:hypothetical protein